MQANGLMLGVDQSLMTDGAPPPSRLSGNAIRFFKQSVQNVEKSAAEGRPIYDAVDYIEIRVPGDKSNIVSRAVRESDKREYAAQYAAWKMGDKEQMTGTPLAMWPPIAQEQVLELAHFGVKSVEQLAATSDGNLANIGPFRTLREQAKAWLEAARGHAPVAGLIAEKERMAEEMAAMRQQLADMGKALDELKRAKKG